MCGLYINYYNLSTPLLSDDAEKSTVSYTANTRSQRHLHNTKRSGPNREHWCGAGRIPSEGQVRTSYNSKVLELVNYAYLGWWGYWGLYSSRAWTSPSRIKSIFLLGISLKRILQDPFLMRLPLDSAKHGEQVISLYTWYVGGKQILINIVGL